MAAHSIQLAQGAEDNGFASMIAGLVEQNLQEHPEKVADFRRLHGRVALVAEDACVSLTLHFQGDRLTVHDGIFGMPDVTLRGDGEDLMGLSTIEVIPPFGIPDPRGPQLRKLLGRIRSGKLRIHGALLGAPILFRLGRVLGVG